MKKVSMISKKISQITPSLTLGITSKVKKMKEEGIDVIGFGAGEPDFDTPIHIKEAAKKAIDQGFTKYTPSSGIQELKDAICEKFKKDNNLNYLPNNILVSCGAKHSVFNTIFTLCEQNDEVILPSPYWLSYPEMIKIAGAKPIIIPTAQNNFKITPIQLQNAITSKTKLFILNSPSNPTGIVYTKQELQNIAEILVKTNVFCLSDEIYEKIIYDDNKHISIASLGKEIKEKTIVINGVSKSYAMTGWRIGYAAANAEIIQAMSSLQDHSTSNPTSIAQKASLCALKSSQEILDKMVLEFAKRRDYIVARLNSIKMISVLKPNGAFYVFPNISKISGKSFNDQVIKDSISLSNILLTEAKIAVVPGIVFGENNYIRLSYATSYENIVKGLDRFTEFVEKLR